MIHEGREGEPFTCAEPRGTGEQEEEEGGKGEKTLGWKEEGTQDILIQLQTRLPGR